MFSLMLAIAMHAAPAPTVTLPVTVITVTVRAPHKAGELTNCGDWKPLESGSGMVRTCEVSK